MKKNRIRLKGRLKNFLMTFLYLDIILILVTFLVFMLGGVRAGSVLSVFTILNTVIVLFVYFKTRPIFINELISFATQYGQIQKTLLREMDLPSCLLDDTGKIIWSNIAFEKTVHEKKGFNKQITAVFPSVTSDKLPAIDDEEVQYDLEYENNFYSLRMRKISLEEMASNSDIIEAKGYDGYLIIVYLFDQTALRLAVQEVDDQSMAAGLIYLDNYEEALESVEEVRRSLLIALIDRKINKYIASCNGIVRKTEKDKYFVVMPKRYCKQMQEARFDILEDVKTVNIGNEMAVTLSIGMGVDGLSYSQNYEFARNAIDLALGRGGDQAVVKTPDNTIYYGGKSQQVEKNTRVKARVKAHALREIITANDTVLVMGHRLGDVDSFGASVGINRISKVLGRKCHIVLNDVTKSMQPLVDLFKNNPEYESDMIIGSQAAIDMAGGNVVLVVVDVNKPSITECPELLRFCKNIVVLDHHRQGSEKIENATLSYIEPYASSASEMVAEILQYISDSVKLRPLEADCIYSGIMIDTNNFMTKTGVRTFEAAAYLRRNGADVTRVRKLFRDDVNDYKARAEAVRGAEIYRDHFAIGVAPNQGIKSPTIIGAQAANELLNINGIKASFVLTDYQDQIYISARSIDEVNVQIIMERLGGGGHMNIAGTQIKNATVEEVRQQLMDLIDMMLREGDL